MKTRILMLIASLNAGSSEAATVLSPFALGNASTAAPFFTTTNFAPSVRYQQVYSGSDFERYGSFPYLITAMSFDAGSGLGGSVTLSNLQINLSTTEKSPDALSTVFGANVGPDVTTVFSGPATVTVTGFEWNMTINFQRPFLFDPGTGNLLMDVKNFQTIPPIPVVFAPWTALSVLTAGDSTSFVGAFDVNSPNATFTSTAGLLTLFTVTPVPEPRSVSLLAAGISLLAALGHRRNRFRWAGRTSGNERNAPCL